MEDLLLPPPTLLSAADIHPPECEVQIPASHVRFDVSAPQYHLSGSWGRRHRHVTRIHTLGCAIITLLCPCLVVFAWIVLDRFSGSIIEAAEAIWELGPITFGV